MCHLYSLGMCNFPWQDWCQEGWHVTQGDWCTICTNRSTENEKKRRRNEESHNDVTTEDGEGIIRQAKRPRGLEDLDYNDF